MKYKDLSREQKDKRNASQRERRFRQDNQVTKKYEKTEKGFLMRLYRNMESRIKGIQKEKFHLYEGKELLSREEFYEWALNNEDFKRLFEDYRANEFSRKLSPSVDRIDSKKGYTIDNMEFITMSENSRRGSLSESRKK